MCPGVTRKCSSKHTPAIRLCIDMGDIRTYYKLISKYPLWTPKYSIKLRSNYWHLLSKQGVMLLKRIVSAKVSYCHRKTIQKRYLAAYEDRIGARCSWSQVSAFQHYRMPLQLQGFDDAAGWGYSFHDKLTRNFVTSVNADYRKKSSWITVTGAWNALHACHTCNLNLYGAIYACNAWNGMPSCHILIPSTRKHSYLPPPTHSCWISLTYWRATVWWQACAWPHSMHVTLHKCHTLHTPLVVAGICMAPTACVTLHALHAGHALHTSHCMHVMRCAHACGTPVNVNSVPSSPCHALILPS